MRIHVPFTDWDVHISKRGIDYVKNGQLVGYSEWLGGAVYTRTSPIMESVYRTIAQEFAKIDLQHVTIKDGAYKLNRNSRLNYLISERPNPLQSKFDFLFTMMYQLARYGNAVAYIYRDKNGQVTSIEPINVADYEFGNGYDLGEGMVLMKYKNTLSGMIELVDYRNVIHLRANPNNIFYGDLFSDSPQIFVDLVDAGLQSLIKELRENGTVRGIIQIGGAATGYARGVATRVLAGQEEKVTKQEEIIERIKKTKGGILVLDAGEEWKTLGNPFSTTSTADINKYIDLLYQFNGINGKVVDGTANADHMEVFFQKTIRPRIEQFVSELNYKVFSRTALTQGQRIEYYRNPFEYVPIDRAIDVAYKAHNDLTTNELRTLVYKLPPIDGGDELMYNKNFDSVSNVGNYKKLDPVEDRPGGDQANGGEEE